MDLKTEFRPIPPEVAVNPASETPLRRMGLTPQAEQALRDVEFETAGEVASCSAEDLMTLLLLTPITISEIEDALAQLGLGLRRV